MSTWYSEHPVARRVLWVIGSIIALLAILLIVLSLLSDALWKHLIEKTVADKTNREVKIEGPVHVRLWRWTPAITVMASRWQMRAGSRTNPCFR